MIGSRRIRVLTLLSVSMISIAADAQNREAAVERARPATAPISRADRADLESAVGRFMNAVERSRATPEFRGAVEKRDSRALRALLVRNGAPSDLVVTIPESGSTEIKISLSCCSKWKIGPITLSVEL
jgi:hypothetical protein